MKNLIFNAEKYQLKSCYSEMNQYEFINIANLRSQFMVNPSTNVEYNVLRICAFRILSNVPEDLINKITADQWVDILPFLDFVFMEVPKFIGNLIPSIKIGKLGSLRYYGPIGLMDKCTVDEFTRIDTAFVKASNGKDTDQLAVMLSYMYRPERKDLAKFRKSSKWNNDIREEFNAERCKERLPEIKKLPVQFLVANYLYFASVREQRFKILKYLFAETESKIHMDDRGWAGSMLQLSHSGVFGNFEEQMNQNWFTVMVEMDRLSEQNIKQNEAK